MFEPFFATLYCHNGRLAMPSMGMPPLFRSNLLPHFSQWACPMGCVTMSLRPGCSQLGQARSNAIMLPSQAEGVPIMSPASP